MEYVVKILKIEPITHDVNRYTVEKPQGFVFTPGQATDVSINKPEFREDRHAFTFTCLNSDNHLEFTIKSYKVSEYPNHSGFTEKLPTLLVGDELVITKPFGTISYKGKGVFLAGGAGITPFIAILRDLNFKNELVGNKLLFSNKTGNDIIIRNELEDMFKDNPNDLIFTLTREEKAGLKHGRITEEFLKEYISDFNTNFYICGPKPFKHGLIDTVKQLGASVDSLIFES